MYSEVAPQTPEYAAVLSTLEVFHGSAYKQGPTIRESDCSDVVGFFCTKHDTAGFILISFMDDPKVVSSFNVLVGNPTTYTPQTTSIVF